MIRDFLKRMNVVTIIGGILCWLILLDLLPRFTVVLTALAIVSVFLTHFLRKWTK